MKGKVDTHHRRPRSLSGSSDPQNLSRVLQKHHKAWHLLFKNYDPERIARLINCIWLDPDYEFIAQKKCNRRIIEEGVQ